MDYTSLVSGVQAATENDSLEFIGSLPDIVGRGQGRLISDIDDLGLTTYTSIAVSAANAHVSVPSNGELIKSFTVENGGTKTNLLPREYLYLTDYWPVSASTGDPKYYGLKTNTKIQIAPTPVSTVDGEISYVARLTTLTSATPTNYLTEHCPEAIFNACMLESAYYMKDYSTIQFWQGEYNLAVGRVRNRSRRSRQDDMQTNWSPAGTPNTIVKGGN
tara:strand:- start:1 stop:654 length:654 start_codon:yes stop_codon:yes gene_type:complete